MVRVKGGIISRKRRKKILKQAKGYYGSKSLLFKTAKEQVMKSYSYAYRDRRQKKRDFRSLWIARINAESRQYGISYSIFINGLKNAGIDINRKNLSELAVNNKREFASLVDIVKKQNNAKIEIV